MELFYIKWVTFSVFGIIIGHSILLRLSTHRMISKNTLEFFKIFLIPLSFLLQGVFFKEMKVSLWSVIVLILLEIVFVVYSLRRRRKQVEIKTLPFLDQIIINMKSGSSLSESLRFVALSPPFQGQIDFSELTSRFNFKLQEYSGAQIELVPRAKWIFNELLQIDQSQNKKIEKLIYLRTRIKREKTFYKKLDQVLLQVKAQISIALLLFGGAILWTYLWEPQFLISVWGIFSCLWFLVGIVLFFVFQKSFQWKI